MAAGRLAQVPVERLSVDRLVESNRKLVLCDLVVRQPTDLSVVVTAVEVVVAAAVVVDRVVAADPVGVVDQVGAEGRVAVLAAV